MQKAFIFTVALAALAASAATTSEAAAQSGRRPQMSGMTMVVGSSRARGCYEHALVRSSSTEALAVCDAALGDAMSNYNRTATYVNRAIVLTQRGQLAAALADLEEALERDPDRAAVHLNFGDVYLKLGQWVDAEAAFTRAIDLNVGRPQIAYYGRAVAREEQDDVAGAYADYMTAAEIAPDWDLPSRELVRFQVVSGSAAAGGA